MPHKIYKIRAAVWLYPGTIQRGSGQVAPWHFVTVPKKESAEIKSKFGKSAKAWGSIPVQVTAGKTSWKTSIFPERKSGAYLLPLKSEVRKKEGIRNGNKIALFVKIGI